MSREQVLQLAAQHADVSTDAHGRVSYDFDEYGLAAFAAALTASPQAAPEGSDVWADVALCLSNEVLPPEQCPDTPNRWLNAMRAHHEALCRALTSKTASPQVQGVASDDELPGMWARSDLIGGKSDFDEMRAATPQRAPGEAEALAYATRLARVMHREHFAGESPDWVPCDDLMGVLSQIDNMLPYLARKRAAPVSAGDGDAIEEMALSLIGIAHLIRCNPNGYPRLLADAGTLDKAAEMLRSLASGPSGVDG